MTLQGRWGLKDDFITVLFLILSSASLVVQAKSVPAQSLDKREYLMIIERYFSLIFR